MGTWPTRPSNPFTAGPARVEIWVVEKVVGTWDTRKDVENDEKDDGMCEKCRDAGRGNIERFC